MLHPLLKLVATQPQLLAEHAQAYAKLVASEVTSASATWKRRALLNAVALCCMGVAAVLAGVALMLWAVVPVADIRVPWALVAAPVVPAALAAWCLWAAQPRSAGFAFDSLRQQMKADIVMLSEASAS